MRPYSEAALFLTARQELAMKVRGISILEVMVVLVIIGIVAALAYPVLSSARERAQVEVTASKLRQIGIALQIYRSDHGGQDSGTPYRMGSPLGGLPPQDLPTVLRLPEDTFKCSSPKSSWLNPTSNSGIYKCFSCLGMVLDPERREAISLGWATLSEVHGTRMPFVGMMCHSDVGTPRDSPFSRHFGLGVNFEGALLRRRAAGSWQVPEWWIVADLDEDNN